MKKIKADSNWRTRHIDGKLGPRVEQLHGERGFTRADVARLLGVSDAALQHIEDGTARMSASQLWQICAFTGIEIADVFAGLPTHVFRTRADFERYVALRQYAAEPGAQGGNVAGQNGFAGVAEPLRAFETDETPRPDVAALAKVARSLTPDQVEFLIGSAKGLRQAARSPRAAKPKS